VVIVLTGTCTLRFALVFYFGILDCHVCHVLCLLYPPWVQAVLHVCANFIWLLCTLINKSSSLKPISHIHDVTSVTQWGVTLNEVGLQQIMFIYGSLGRQFVKVYK
jgi:hypothetical protein